MDFVKYFAMSSVKQNDDISDIFPISFINSINLNKCFDVRPNNDIVCLNRKKFNKVIDVLSNFSQYDFLNKFKTVMGSDFIKMLNDVINHKIIIPEQCMGMFIIYIILNKYNCSLDLELINLFDFIHVDRYFEQIRKLLNIISLSEYIIKFRSDNYFNNKYILPLYLLNRGEKLLYNPHCFNESCLKKVLVNDNFELAFKLISLGCNLYENEQSFNNSPLFYAMFLRNRNNEGFSQIPNKQWLVIKLMLIKCKRYNFQINPINLTDKISPVCLLDRELFHNVIEFEQFGVKSCHPLIYTLLSYPFDKFEFIFKMHSEFITDIWQYDKLKNIIVEYIKKNKN